MYFYVPISPAYPAYALLNNMTLHNALGCPILFFQAHFFEYDCRVENAAGGNVAQLGQVVLNGFAAMICEMKEKSNITTGMKGYLQVSILSQFFPGGEHFSFVFIIVKQIIDICQNRLHGVSIRLN